MIVAGAAVVVVSEPTRVGSLALGGDAAGPIAAGGRSPLDLMERALRPSLVPLEPDWCRFAGLMLPSSSLTHGMLRALRSMGPIAAVGPIAMDPNRMPLGST